MRLNFKLTFDATVWLVKKNLKILVLLSLLNGVGYYLYSHLLLPSLPTITPSMKAAEVLSLSFKMFLFTIGTNIISSFLSFLEYAFIVISVVSVGMTPPTPLMQQLRYIGKRIFPLLLTAFLSSLIVFLGTLFFIIPGLIFVTKYSQAFFFCLVDGENPINSLKYSSRITKGNYLRLAWMYFLFSLVQIPFLIPMLLPIPAFLKVVWYSFVFTLNILVNYVVWKILKQNFYSGHDYPTMSRGRKILIGVLGIVILVMIVVAIRSISASNKRFNKTLNITNVLKQVTPSQSPSSLITTVPVATQIPLPTSTPYPTPTIIDISETKSWQTYTNKTYGYSVKYPLDFVVQSLSEKIKNTIKSPNVAIRSVDGKKYITLVPEDGVGIDKKIRDTQSGGVILYLESETATTSGNKIVVMSTEGGFSGISEYIAFIEKDLTSTLVVKLGPIPSKELEKEYKTFFYTIISTISFNK